MDKLEIIFDTIIKFGFYALAFLVPLILSPLTSEVFEFNKLISVYILTTIIIGAWIGKMILNKKFLLRRSLLDIPLLVFLSSQLISTFLSIDFRTSLLGYYSRFNGGLISSLCYVLLYWAFVSNFDKRKTLNFIYVTLSSAVLVCLYGVLQHAGIDKHLWVQDVQTRVFSTLGQPNWLAAWTVSLAPLAWSFALKSDGKSGKAKFWLWTGLSLLFFITLLFTKSRSGILGFTVASIIFWPFVLWKYKNQALKPFIILNSLFIILTFTVDTPWKTAIVSKFNRTDTKVQEQAAIGPALEVGGTESGEIRKIVWQGAIDIWKAYPVFGSGVETFAFSYYKFRPAAHNLVSEWDYLYNKAHNEYLNYLATTGTIGLLSYLILIGVIILLFLNELRKDKDHNSYFIIHISLLAGFVSLLVTNFLGFSVVPTSLVFFLFPAISIGISAEYLVHRKVTNSLNISSHQKITLLLLLCTMLYALFTISKYYLADVNYAKAKGEIRIKDYLAARKDLIQSIKLSPTEAIYLNELAQVDGNLALILYDKRSLSQASAYDNKNEEAKKLAELAEQEASLAQRLSPRNINIKRDISSILTKMSIIDTNFLLKANRTMQELEVLAPTEPKVKLNLAISYLKLGQKDKTKALINEAILLKPNYKEAHYSLAAILADEKDIEGALTELNYVLNKIDPNDEASKNLKAEIEKGN